MSTTLISICLPRQSACVQTVPIGNDSPIIRFSLLQTTDSSPAGIYLFLPFAFHAAPSSQRAEVLAHDEPPPGAAWRVLPEGVPVGHQHEDLVERLGGRVAALAVVDAAGDLREHAALGAAPVPLLEVLGAAERKVRVDDVGVDRLDLVADVRALGVEEGDVVVGPAGEDGAVDGDVGRRGVLCAGGRVEVGDGALGLAAVQGLVVEVDEVGGRWGGGAKRVRVLTDWKQQDDWRGRAGTVSGGLEFRIARRQRHRGGLCVRSGFASSGRLGVVVVAAGGDNRRFLEV